MSSAAGSQEWFERAQRVMPGGVSSPVRAFGAVGGTPLVIRSGSGARITDVDGREFLDFVGSWGPLILGHAEPRVAQAVAEAARAGSSFGAPVPVEIELAEVVVDSYPGIEQVRFVSSGTEAVMSAVRLARGVTGRDLVVKFSGCYHGHVDHLLVAAGSGLATLGTPSSAGVPEPIAGLTRVLPLDDVEAAERLFAALGDAIAAVILEPLPANHGLLVQRREFLVCLRELCDRAGALLIFDEVISGFRLGPGGAAELCGLNPDVATFGKVIGGGLPVGAFAARREIMRRLAPEGGVYQAGTLSGNPVAMAAGLTTVRILQQENVWARLDELGGYLEHTLEPVLIESPVPIRLVRRGSLFWLALGVAEDPRAAEELDPRAPDWYRPLFHGLMERGVLLAPSAFEVGFLSAAHRREDMDELATALEAVLRSDALRAAVE